MNNSNLFFTSRLQLTFLHMKIYLDGQFVSEADAKISVFDHGLLYGDGIFEGIRIYSGKVFRLEEHISRLFESAQAILLEIPKTPQEVADLVIESCKQNNLTDGYIRLIVTRGKGSLGLAISSCSNPSIICIAASIQLYPEEYYQQGLTVVTCSTRRPTVASLPPQVKSLNYLNNVMAKSEALAYGAQEGLMLNEQGFVAECTGDNIFVVRKNVVYTPPIYSGSLEGITREAVLEILDELEIPWIERELVRHELYIADEIFLSGTAAEVVPVRELDQRIIGNGKPGSITQQVMKKYDQLVNS